MTITQEPIPTLVTDVFSGVYRRSTMELETKDGIVPLDRCPVWLIDGQEVVLTGVCEYPTEDEATRKGRVPTRMTITNVTPL